MLFAGGSRRKYNEPVWGKTRLMKEIFLLMERAPNIGPRYEFVAGKYGPNAPQLLGDLTFLENADLIDRYESHRGMVYSLTSFGCEVASVLYRRMSKMTKRRLIDIKISYNDMPLRLLLEYVYTRYPEYAGKSEYREL